MTRVDDMCMPFGKYKDHEISAVPDDYLLWLIANIPLRDPLRSAVAEAVTERDVPLSPLASPPPRPPHRAKRSRTDDDDANGAWTMGGDPQEIIAGDFPVSSRPRDDV